jgi:hypothetical protein
LRHRGSLGYDRNIVFEQVMNIPKQLVSILALIAFLLGGGLGIPWTRCEAADGTVNFETPFTRCCDEEPCQTAPAVLHTYVPFSSSAVTPIECSKCTDTALVMVMACSVKPRSTYTLQADLRPDVPAPQAAAFNTFDASLIRFFDACARAPDTATDISIAMIALRC